MSARFQQVLLVFFIIGIAALLYGLWATTPRNPQPGSCKILEERFCNKGELITWNSPNEDSVTFIGFKLESETLLFSPVDGQIAKSQINPSSSFRGYYGNMTVGETSYNLRGDIKFPNLNTEIVKAGASIGMMSNTGTTNLDGYNLIINIDRYDSAQQKFVAAEDILKKLFDYED